MLINIDFYFHAEEQSYSGWYGTKLLVQTQISFLGGRSSRRNLRHACCMHLCIKTLWTIGLFALWFLGILVFVALSSSTSCYTLAQGISVCWTVHCCVVHCPLLLLQYPNVLWCTVHHIVLDWCSLLCGALCTGVWFTVRCICMLVSALQQLHWALSAVQYAGFVARL